jgi:hypothetical protein
MNKAIYTAFRCPVDILEKAKIKATSERRSLSNWLVKLVDENTEDVELPAIKKTAPRKR